MFNIPNYTSMLKKICFYSGVPAEAVTIVILKYPSFHSLCCLMNRKVTSFKQYFCWDNIQYSVKSYKSSKCSLLALTQAHNRFVTVYCPVNTMLFEVSPEIHFSDVSSHYCCYGIITQLVLTEF